ncbi:DUF1778 domain-containing protein [Cupriavidus taiwanensis]|uniref:type II toxin -antitoxin system TacA 1-like antitoxin n=1 Tax=Cupriavidus taiwanensis TaxID=164546 RepID=UPI000E10C770|nr:DUF1778 domain-containing protein [Cupriavidus taiwanensis]SOY52697.1 conserved hypothetical protein [Cupriavidus taiwanensis]SOY85767.1 conserved hypothetical protein [Cupriavidus taiwanensis]SPA15648.1 conserved hypothetical protein [Cupriavidus taiwanensis]SPD44887.1 conserved protein of unknown function [Cupriavidus taiwanensis]
MNEGKTTAINLRMSPEVKDLLRLAAAREHRTLSNMLEYLVLQHCELKGLRLPDSGHSRADVGQTKKD